MNACPGSLLMQKTCLAFGQEYRSDELGLVHFSLNLADAREGGVVIIKAFASLFLASLSWVLYSYLFCKCHHASLSLGRHLPWGSALSNTCPVLKNEDILMDV